MCGIFAHIEKAGLKKEDLTYALKALRVIEHRGPDGEGLVLFNSTTGAVRLLATQDTPSEIIHRSKWPVISMSDYEDLSSDFVFGHRRLSIIELSVMGHQPMCDEETGNWIIFNGEVYNYIELRSELQSLKTTFSSGSDTEVILKAYKEWGTACFNRFNGMWSLIIWDKAKNSFVISNDRFGVKPLFYFGNKDRLIFASEQKQLLVSPKLTVSLNKEAIQDFLYDTIINPVKHTFFNEIHRFKPSSYAEVSLTKLNGFTQFNYTAYYKLAVSRVNNLISETEAIEQFNQLLQKAVDLRMRADVPYAFALSGGLDSTAVLLAASQINKLKNLPSKLATFSVIFPGLPGDESDFINEVIKHVNVQSYFAEPFKSFSIEQFKSHVFHQDFPVQNTSYYAEYALAKKVSEEGFKILIVGQGADEIFGGYTAYFYQYAVQLLSHARAVKLISEVKGFSEIKGISEKVIFTQLIQEYKQILKYKYTDKTHFTDQQKRIVKARSLSEILSLDLLEYTIPLYLHSDDADGMAFSIESRHPFLDVNLVDFGYALPDKYKINRGWQKVIIRKAMQNMPEKIRWRKDKKGYTTPHQIWLERYKSDFKLYEKEAHAFATARGDLFRLSSLGVWLSNIKMYDAYKG